jgi:hypothetical protein
MDLLLHTSVIHPNLGIVTVAIGNDPGEGVWPLTQCCKASAKGLDGVVCRECYNQVPEFFAHWAPTVNDLKALCA